jgi:hypothetical protein
MTCRGAIHEPLRGARFQYRSMSPGHFLHPAGIPLRPLAGASVVGIRPREDSADGKSRQVGKVPDATVFLEESGQ